jgi:hypothetical protein
VTLEDLQGSIEVVVFPKLFEQTGPIWAEGAILLVAGRVDHRGEDVSLLADLVIPWDEAVMKGAESFAREVAAGDRGGVRRRPVAPVVVGETNGNGDRPRNGNGHRNDEANGHPGPPAGPQAVISPRRPDIPYVSPLRADAASRATLPSIAPAEPVSAYPARASAPGDTAAAPDDEPALPDEARTRALAEAAAPTTPLETPGPGHVLHVRFGGAPADQLVGAMEMFRQLIRERPGETRVVVHVPAPGGAALPMELKQTVAYDSDLLAEVQRRLGVGIAQVSLG